MRRMVIALACLGWLTWLASACAGVATPAAEKGVTAQVAQAGPSPTPHPTNTPFPRPTPRVPNRNYYTKRCWPACHLDPAYVHDSRAITTDEFEGELGPGWSWLNEDPAHWSLEEPGVLRIVTQPADLNRPEATPNTLLRAAPEGHFDIIAEMVINPTANGQAAVLLIQTEEGESIFLIRGYCDEAPVCVGSGVYFSTTMPDCPPAGLPFEGERTTLMLRRSGNSYIGYVLSGEEWVEVGRCFRMLTPTRVGLTAVNSGPDVPQIQVDFESFTLVERH